MEGSVKEGTWYSHMLEEEEDLNICLLAKYYRSAVRNTCFATVVFFSFLISSQAGLKLSANLFDSSIPILYSSHTPYAQLHLLQYLSVYIESPYELIVRFQNIPYKFSFLSAILFYNLVFLLIFPDGIFILSIHLVFNSFLWHHIF